MSSPVSGGRHDGEAILDDGCGPAGFALHTEARRIVGAGIGGTYRLRKTT